MNQGDTPEQRRSTDSETRSVLDSIRRIVQALRVSSRAAEKAVGVSGAQLFVLQKLAEAGGQSLNALAERTRTHQSSLSVVVQRLVERGLVERRRSEADARRLELTVTDDGRALLNQSPDPVQLRLIEGLERLPPTERATLARLLERWVQEAGIAAGAVPLFFEEDEPASTGSRKEDHG